jgi:hypothetical protein
MLPYAIACDIAASASPVIRYAMDRKDGKSKLRKIKSLIHDC